MKQILLPILAGLMFFLVSCGARQEGTAPVERVEDAELVEQVEFTDLADGVRGWAINVDTLGSSVVNFENLPQNLSFTLNRATEIPELEKWSWAEIVYFNPSGNWYDLTHIDITYSSNEEIVLILADSELAVYNPAAGFFTILPSTNGEEVSLTLTPSNIEEFRQHDWVSYNFPMIRTVFDPTTIFGIKLGTTAIGGSANASISRFVLNGVNLSL